MSRNHSTFPPTFHRWSGTRRSLRLRGISVCAFILCALGLLLPADPLSRAHPDEGLGGVGRMQVDPSRDWPLFGGSPQRNMVNRDALALLTDWEVKKGGKHLRWVVDAGTRGYVPPAISGGRVYLAANNEKPRDPKIRGRKAVLMCFREFDGTFLWQITHDMPPNAGMAEDEGLLSTPAVERDRLYYVAPGAEVVCADTRGKVVWRLDMMKQLKVSPCGVSYCSPLLAGDLLFVVTGNGRELGEVGKPLPQPRAPSFVAIDKNTGKVVWQDSSPGANVMEGQWTSPAYAEIGGRGQVIFPGGDGWLYAFEPKDGKLLWKFDCNPKGSEFRQCHLGTRSYLMAAPVVCDGKVYIGTGQNPHDGPGPGHLWCIDPNGRGDVSPELETAAPGKKPTTKPNPKSAAVWHYGGAAPPEADRDYLFGRTVSTCAVHDGLVYAAEVNGYLHCLDAKTGEHYWVEDLRAETWASPLWADGKVYMPDGSGFVHILAHGKEKKVLNKVDMDKGIKAPIVVANGVIFVRNETQLYAIGPRR